MYEIFYNDEFIFNEFDNNLFNNDFFEQRRVRKLKLKTLRKKIRELKKIIEQNISRFVTIKLISFLLNNIFIVFNER